MTRVLAFVVTAATIFSFVAYGILSNGWATFLFVLLVLANIEC